MVICDQNFGDGINGPRAGQGLRIRQVGPFIAAIAIWALTSAGLVAQPSTSVPESTPRGSAAALMARDKQVAQPTAEVKTQTAEKSAASVELSTPAAPAADRSVGDMAVVERVNEHLRQSWQEHDVQPVSAATDGEWCRRLYLDLLGRIPTVAETDRFLKSSDRTKRADLVKQILYGAAYQPELVRHWGTVWTNTLIGRDAAAGNDPMVDAAAFRSYLEESIRESKPYDQLVRELLAAEGKNLSSVEGHNGAVNFLTGRLEDKATQATSDTARIFLGIQVQCTQCHNHPFNDWKQDQFWGLNAFFRQTVALRKTSLEAEDGPRVLELTNQDFGGENSRRATPEQAEVYYELRNGDLRTAYPTFLDGSTISPSGYLSDVNRREELANLVSKSELLAPALVNRLWGHFLGYGFTKPVDDMGPHNPPSHPELLEFLAGEFRQAKYDLRRLMSWIVLSDAYGLSSRGARKDTADNPASGTPPQFTRFYIRQMQPEQLYDSLLIVTKRETGQSSSATVREKAADERQEWLRQFTINLATDDGGETTTFNGTIPQTLMMFNGSLIREATRCDDTTWLGAVWRDSRLAGAEKIHYLYRAALGRSATRKELNAYGQLLAASGGNAQEAFEDLWWAILNSNEFILVH